MSKTKNRFAAFWQRIWHSRSKALFLVAFGASAAVASLVFVPSLYKPYVRVASSTVSIALSCVPQTIQVESLTKYAKLRRADIIIKDAVDGTTSTIGALVTPRVDAGGAIVVGLMLQPDDLPVAGTFLAEHGARSRVHVLIEFDPIPYVDLRSVVITPAVLAANSDCGSRELRGNGLFERTRQQPSHLMRHTSIRDTLSDVIWLANDLVGNFVLAFMLVWGLVLVTVVHLGFWRYRLSTDETIVALYRAHLSEVPDALASAGPAKIVNAVHAQLHRNLAFARVVGPALGFVLTVSSLVAGLHPSAHATHDTFHFISSLQIALIATFMGLAIRILAEFAIRFHREVGDRMIDLATKETY